MPKPPAQHQTLTVLTTASASQCKIVLSRIAERAGPHETTKWRHTLVKKNEESKEQEQALQRLRKGRETIMKVRADNFKMKGEAYAILQALDNLERQ